jgi:WD40 repeat protein
VPCTLLVALAVTFNQYWAALKTQAEKEYQLQIATSRQQAAIAQTILQEPDSDPTTALLISRVAAEKGGRTDEAQASLRNALQKLQLQAKLGGHRGIVRQVAFNPNNRQVATAGEDGTIRLWSLTTYGLERVLEKAEEKAEGQRQKAEGRLKDEGSGMRDESSGQKAEEGGKGQRDGGSGMGDENQNPTFKPPFSALRPRSPLSAPTPPPPLPLAFSADGRYLGAIASGSRAVLIWNASTGELQFRLDAGQVLTQVVFSPQQGWLAAVGADGQVLVWNASSGRLQAQMQPSGGLVQSVPGKLTTLQFSPDGNWLLTASGTTVQLWQVQTGQLSKTLHHPAIVRSAGFRGVEGIVTASEDGIARLWQVRTGQLRQTFLYRDRRVPSLYDNNTSSKQVILSQDGQFLAAVDGQWRVEVWRVASGQLVSRLGSQQSRLRKLAGQAIAFSPDSQRIVTASQVLGEDGSIYLAHIWNVQTGAMTGELRGHGGAIQSVAFSGDGSLVATASMDGTARLWATAPGSEFPSLEMAGRPMQWVTLQDAVVGVAADGTLQRWNLLQFNGLDENKGNLTAGAIAPATGADSAALNRLLPAGATLTAVGFNQSSRLLATADSSGSVNLWQVEPDWRLRRIHQLPAVAHPPTHDRTDPPATTGQMTARQMTIRQIIQQFAWSPDGQRLLGVGADRVIYLWDTGSGKLVNQLQGHAAAIAQAQFSPDGQRIVSASQDRTVRVWQVSSARLLSSFQHQSAVNSAHFSPDGQRIITASSDGIARVLDAMNGELRVILAGHRGAVMDARFSPDGHLLATASADGTARVWDAHTGIEKALLRPTEFPDRGTPMRQTVFSPDGQYLATLSQDGRLHLWATTWTGLLRLARDRSVRQLQPEECLQYLRLTPNACPVLEIKTENGSV